MTIARLVAGSASPRAVAPPAPSFADMEVAMVEVGFITARQIEHFRELARRDKLLGRPEPVFTFAHIEERLTRLAAAKDLISELAAGRVKVVPVGAIKE